MVTERRACKTCRLSTVHCLLRTWICILNIVAKCYHVFVIFFKHTTENSDHSIRNGVWFEHPQLVLRVIPSQNALQIALLLAIPSTTVHFANVIVTGCERYRNSVC